MKNNNFMDYYPYNLLTEYFITSNNIDYNTEYSIFEIDANELILSQRIDLMAKIEYINFKEKNINCDFAKELYIKHIEAFSNGTYTEPGTPEKNSINKYLKEFDNMIDEIKTNGFNPAKSLIPIGKNNEILDGSHRTSISAYFNKKVTVIKFNSLTRNYNYKFFKDRLLDEDYTDYLISKYCELKNNIYIACLWPIANEEKYIEYIDDIVKRNECNIVCSKQINLSYKGLRNFMIQIYGHQDWIGNYRNGFKGVNQKVDSCYRENKETIIYVLESDEFENILNIKQEVRKLIGIGNHSIHITDNKLESIQISKLVFNKNSIQHLNRASPNKYIEFNDKINIYKKRILNNNLDMNDFIIDSSGVMGIFGIRDCTDIDFLSLCVNQDLVTYNNIIDKHDSELKYYDINKDTIIYDPRNFFIYNDLKFTTLSLLKKMKKNRKEDKDMEDIKLINNYIKNENIIETKYLLFKNNLKRKKRFLEIKIKTYILCLLKRILKK